MNPEKTAISRNRESRPVRELYRAGVFDSEPILDYGCGKGTDVMYLNGKGISTFGYDKYHYPVKHDFEFNIILCNYVINVIDNYDDIMSIIADIMVNLKYGGKIIITTRSKKEVDTTAKKSGWATYNNGYRTKKDTFQKGYSHEELVKLITELAPVKEIPCPVKSSSRYTVVMFQA